MDFLRTLWAFPFPVLHWLLRKKHIKRLLLEDNAYYRLYGAEVATWKWWPKPYVAVALYPGILVRSEEYAEQTGLMVHEEEHLRQQMAVSGIGFLASYGAHYLWNYLVPSATRFNHMAAYRAIYWEVVASHVENEHYRALDMEQNLELGTTSQDTLS